MHVGMSASIKADSGMVHRRRAAPKSRRTPERTGQPAAEQREAESAIQNNRGPMSADQGKCSLNSGVLKTQALNE